MVAMGGLWPADRRFGSEGSRPVPSRDGPQAVAAVTSERSQDGQQVLTASSQDGPPTTGAVTSEISPDDQQVLTASAGSNVICTSDGQQVLTAFPQDGPPTGAVTSEISSEGHRCSLPPQAQASFAFRTASRWSLPFLRMARRQER